MTAQDLKNSILQMAVQGKLVPQDPNDEPASELLARIQAEKEKLIKDKKIKREKNPSVIFRGADNTPYEKIGDEIKPLEVPFDIPESWEWVRLGTISFITKLAGFEYTKYIAPSISDKGIPLFKGKNIQDGTLVKNFESYIPEFVSDELWRSQLSRRCLLTPYVGSIGNVAIFSGEYKAHLGSNVGKIEPYIDEDILIKYIWYFLRSIVGFKQLSKHKKATAQESISIAAIRDVLFPLPPLAEQHRIVAKIEELLPFIDEYNEKEQEITKLNADFPEQLKKSILQEAVQGKLVSQDPSDEPASELLVRIRTEKQKLIKDGKIKKDKHESVIFRRDNSHYEKVDGTLRCIDDEIPFDIPESWEWVRLKQIVYNRGQCTPLSDFCYIDIGSIDNKNQKLSDEDNILHADKAPSRARKIVGQGDILYSTVRPYLHNMCIVDRRFPCQPIASTGFAELTCHDILLNKYLFYFLMSPNFDTYANNTENSKGVAYPAINDERLYKALVPLPPLAEQHRIVAKIEEMLPLIKGL